MPQGRCAVSGEWLDDSSYQAILRETHTIAFQFNAVTREQRVSPYIGEYISGDYDGRLLSDVMLEDNIIHPKDLAKSIIFREQVAKGQLGEIVIRLMTPGGEYRWFRMVMTRKSGTDAQVFVGVLEDVNIQMQYQEFLRHRAEIDPISGIYNREFFLEQTEKLLEAECDRPHFILCFDIDRFKFINRLFGNAEGDKVLRYIGDILKELSHPNEVYGRQGGDIFVACVSRTKTETISLIQEIEHSIRTYPLAFRFFLSTGIVPIPQKCKDPVSELCDRAAMAQHKIKGNYLRTYLFYEISMERAMEREHALIAAMETSLEDGAFFAYFQPKFDMYNRQVIGAEALARWNHPALGMISPSDFIPLFERNGFIIRLDEFIWESACKVIRKWIDLRITPVPISVNVSRMHLYNKDFCRYVINLCDHYEIPHHLLELEITESAYTESPQELFPVMEELQQAGFIFSMDDFGSGYSSLNMLKDIPIDTVKFDLKFLGEARRGKQAALDILKNIVQLMNDLRISILVEGVETENQANYLQDIGCRYAQGFYYARPMPPSDLQFLLHQESGRPLSS